MTDLTNYYSACSLCNRLCGINRKEGGRGFCGCDSEMRICRAELHFWEEPVISGARGSGTVFFSGCSLGCVFCQNHEISRAPVGRKVTPSELADIMLSLEARGAHNINFVTPTHLAPSVIMATELSRERGMALPTVYNTGSYDAVSTIRMLKDTVDIYLPDYKYYSEKTARAMCGLSDYPRVALLAIEEMVKQQPTPVIEDGIMKKGVIIRTLLLPSHLAETKLALKRLFSAFGNSVYYSLLGQYTPIGNMKPPLDRRVTVSEYGELVEYAVSLGIENGFTQELSSAREEYIPDFEK